MGLIQVQRQCRRLYDDEEHLGDRRARNFLVVHRRRTCTPLCMRVQHTHTLANHISKPVRGGWGIEETNKQAEERRETTDGKRSITRFPDPPLGARLCIFAFRRGASQTKTACSENGLLDVSSTSRDASFGQRKKKRRRNEEYCENERKEGK
ncbi:hypothetical protein ALC57_02331 [Trachymyrmex cornetzi]|uniref:Uncharacterized protein n=1 Tax=Trachymyrmex cornetzi TaxID=471704 RepID=A0A195EJ31_9HYME|nr:hypothetical protein ALC57_02331 [Trachymyrmex cornetzi]